MMTKEDIKKSILTGIISGVAAAFTLLVSLWLYITVTDWYKSYKTHKMQQEMAQRAGSGIWNAIPCPRHLPTVAEEDSL